MSNKFHLKSRDPDGIKIAFLDTLNLNSIIYTVLLVCYTLYLFFSEVYLV